MVGFMIFTASVRNILETPPKKCSVLPRKYKNGFPLHVYRTTKYSEWCQRRKSTQAYM
jgi:hypothetical protein